MGRNQRLSKLRSNCEFRDRCGKTGHYRDEQGRWFRCQCLELEINRKRLGLMFTENPVDRSKLMDLQDKNLILTGPLEILRRHVASVLLGMASEGESWVTMDAYRLIEIFLDQDQEFSHVSAATGKDLLILLLGFGDPPNKYLPELILQAVNRRELIGKPTWIILGIPKERIPTKYSVELGTKLEQFQVLGVR